MKNKIHFANRLLELLREKKLTVKEFSKKIGMSEIGLHNAIKNNSTKLETIAKISEELNVPIEYFFKANTDVCMTEDLDRANEIRETLITFLKTDTAKHIINKIDFKKDYKEVVFIDDVFTKDIRYFLKTEGITSAFLAKKIGVSNQNLSQRLNRDDMKISMMVKIAKALKIEKLHFLITPNK